MPFASFPPNARCFILFRILFNCRFYYPIYTIFFLDAGLSLDQFATLNLLWALSIVVLEVPSGALADQLGRRKLIVASTVLMVLEMACLAFLPIKAGGLTFWIFALNRVLSGAAEACASGADEALTYDSLPEEGREDLWAKIQGRLMRIQSICFVATMFIGAFVYEASFVNRMLGYVGIQANFSAATTMKFPVILCFLMALCCFAVALRFTAAPGEKTASKLNWSSLSASFAGVGKTAGWLWRSPVPMALLCVGLLGDSFMRLFYTIGSQFYRVIQIPTEWNGAIGAAAALSGLLFAPWVEKLSKTLTGKAIYGFVAVLIFVGYLGLAFPIPYWGILAAVPFWFGMRALHFNLSAHLNAVVPADQRATALSFRGLSMNLAYGIVMQGFGLQTLSIAQKMGITEQDPSACDQIFRQAMQAWPWLFVIAAGLVALKFANRLPAASKA